MSRGPGRIERTVEQALRDTDRSFTVEELAKLAYPGIGRVEKKHRVVVLRGISNIQKRLDLWFFDTVQPPWQMIVTKRGNVRSYVHGWFRSARQDYSLSQIDELMNVPEICAAMAPGGYFWCEAEYQKADVELKKLGFKSGMALSDMSAELRSLWDLCINLNSYAHCLPVHDDYAFLHIAERWTQSKERMSAVTPA